MVRTRFAPSPTGKDAHVGTAYTALLNLAFAKQKGGQFILRLEDTDRRRFVPEFEENFKRSLDWLGMGWDEGPDLGGPFGPYRQSERLDLYRRYALELVEKGAAYFCLCSKERLEALRIGQAQKGQPTKYDGRCRDLAAKEGVVRLRVPLVGQTSFHDVVRGDVVFANSSLDDQILLKTDGYPTYHLAVVVDDHLMKISHIIRAEEWLPSTPKQILLYQAFGWTPPVIAHTPMLRNPDRSKLSKRRNPVWVSWYREEGFLPEAILNYLALQAWSHPEGKEIFALDEFVAKFSLERIQKTGPVFDLGKLRWMNGEHMRALEPSTLTSRLKAQNSKLMDVDDKYLEKIVALAQTRIKTLNEFYSLTAFFFEEVVPDEQEWERAKIKGQPKTEALGAVLTVYEHLPVWSKGTLEEATREVARDLKIKDADLFMLLRVAVTGKSVSPPLFESLEILGKEKTIKSVSRSGV